MSDPIKVCGSCNSEYGQCAECSEIYPLGTMSRCPKPECQASNAPIDCACGFVTSDTLDGVLDFAMELIPWKT